MKSIIAFLLLASTAVAADHLFDKWGQKRVAGDGQGGRSVADWCDLATTAKSVEKRWEYSHALAAIAKKDSDLSAADKALLRAASLAVLKHIRQDDQYIIPGGAAKAPATMLCNVWWWSATKHACRNSS